MRTPITMGDPPLLPPFPPPVAGLETTASLLLGLWLAYLERQWWLDYGTFVDCTARYVAFLFVTCCPADPEVLIAVLSRFMSRLHSRPTRYHSPSTSLDVPADMFVSDTLSLASVFAGFPLRWGDGAGYQDAYDAWWARVCHSYMP